MGSKVFAFGDIAGPVQFGKPAVLKKATHPELTERAAFVLASRPCRAYRVIRRSRSRVMPAASMAIARTVTSDMSIPVWARESAADVLPPPGNCAHVRARLGGRRAITRRATRHGTGLVLLIAARRGAVRSGLRDDSTAGGSSERPSTVARMVPVRLFLFARVADCCATCRCCRDTCLKPSAWLSSLCSREPPVLSARAICRRAHHRRLHQRFEPYRHRDRRFQQSHG